MSHGSSAGSRRSSLAREHTMDSEEVLDMLRDLIQQVSSPVVQECLRAARCEIAYLTSSEGNFPDEDEDEEDDLEPDEVLNAPKHRTDQQCA